MAKCRGKICLLSVVLMLTGCGISGTRIPEKPYVIGAVTKSGDSEYWMSVCAGMEAAAAEYQAEVVILSPDSESDKKTQKKMVQDLLKMQVDALAVSPIDSFDNQEEIQKAGELGIPVYAYDTPFADADLPYIGIDNEKVGYELAEAMAEKLGHTGKIAVIAGSMDQASHKQRVQGFERYMESESGIVIELLKTGYSNLKVSEKEMEDIQKQYPDLDGIMTTSAVTALGLAEAMEGKHLVIASVDAQEDAVRAVEEGRITVLGAQSGYEIGYETVRYIMNDKNGVEQEKEKILDAQILTQENES